MCMYCVTASLTLESHMQEAPLINLLQHPGWEGREGGGGGGGGGDVGGV